MASKLLGRRWATYYADPALTLKALRAVLPEWGGIQWLQRLINAEKL